MTREELRAWLDRKPTGPGWRARRAAEALELLADHGLAPETAPDAECGDFEAIAEALPLAAAGHG